MKLTLAMCFLLFPSMGYAQDVLKEFKAVVAESVGPPGHPVGDKTVMLAINGPQDIQLAFICSAGKEEGAGDKIVTAAIEGLEDLTKGVSRLFRNVIKRNLEKAVVNSGDSFCFVIAKEAGSLKRAKNISEGSIYTTSWKDGKEVSARTDTRACKKLRHRFACFEVADAPEDSTPEIDGVSGCFQAKFGDALRSYSFGRGANIPKEIADTFLTLEASMSETGCVERGLGKDITD